MLRRWILEKNIGKGQFFITFDEDGPDDMKTSCREYTLPRNEEASRARGWIRGNTKIGPVLKVHFHQGRCCVDIMIESFFSRTNSFLGSHREWNQQRRDPKRQKKCLLKALSMVVQEKRVAKAKPRPKPTLMSPVSIPSRERKWIDINPGTYSQGCFELSNFMIRLLGHDESVPREDDGAVRFDDLAEKFKAKFDGTSQCAC